MDRKVIQQKIKIAMVEKGLSTWTELEHELGMSGGYFSQCLAPKSVGKMSARMKITLAMYFEKEMNWLMGQRIESNTNKLTITLHGDHGVIKTPHYTLMYSKII